MTWTEAARDRFERYLAAVGLTASAGGADGAEVTEDLRRHVQANLSESNVKVVTLTELEQMIARLGQPWQIAWAAGPGTGPALHAEKSLQGPTATSRTAGASSAQQGPRCVPAGRAATQVPGGFAWFYIITFGVLCPLLTLGLELAHGMAAQTLFDPLPTWWHALLVLSVPAVNVLMCATLWGRDSSPRKRQLLAVANAFTIGIAGLYALLFLPVAPLALVAILFFGFGFLPLSPFMSLVAALMCRRYLRRNWEEAKPLRLWPGIGLAAAAIVAAHLPGTLTEIGMSLAVSEVPTTRSQGLRLLRAWGSHETLLRACYWRREGFDPVRFIVSGGTPITPSQAREVYFRVTGQEFSKAGPPARSGRPWLWDDRAEDQLQGGEEVGGVLDDLHLTSSRMDGLVDGDAALAYLEWTMVFENTSPRQQEARAEIALPAGGVVSRLTLWVNGEEREAAFAGRAKVRQAYENIVKVQRRDPVLVTTSGPGRVLVQCFPVPPNGGTMKIRFGVTAPVHLTSLEGGVLRLPQIIDRNYRLKSGTKHSVWLESAGEVADASGLLKLERLEAGGAALRGEVPDEQLSGRGVALTALRNPEVLGVWTADPAKGSSARIAGRVSTEGRPTPKRVVLVMDGSGAMKDAVAAVQEAIPGLPQGTEVALVVASDEVLELTAGAQPATQEVLAAAAHRLGEVPMAGGCDSVPALERAWDLAAERPGSLVVWVHGPQPTELAEVEGLRQRWERRPGSVRLLALQAAPGSNRILQGLDGVADIDQLPRLGSPGDDLKRFFESLARPQAVPVVARERVEASQPAPWESEAEQRRWKRTSAHLARLWALEQVLAKCRLPSPKEKQEAATMAAAYQLVTPVSGAVVLETEQQYKAAGLEPVEPGSVPTVPEPETWALIGIVAAVLGWALWKRRRACRGASCQVSPQA